MTNDVLKETCYLISSRTLQVFLAEKL